jgi:hypothetical protein
MQRRRGRGSESPWLAPASGSPCRCAWPRRAVPSTDVVFASRLVAKSPRPLFINLRDNGFRPPSALARGAASMQRRRGRGSESPWLAPASGSPCREDDDDDEPLTPHTPLTPFVTAPTTSDAMAAAAVAVVAPSALARGAASMQRRRGRGSESPWLAPASGSPQPMSSSPPASSPSHRAHCS